MHAKWPKRLQPNGLDLCEPSDEVLSITLYIVLHEQHDLVLGQWVIECCVLALGNPLS